MNNRPAFYVTTPIYYVNSKPHLGTLYSTLIADVVARWNRLYGRDVFFLTGTDEHGQKVAEKAAAAGSDPKAFVDSAIPAFKEVWKLYNLQYSYFIRTTDPAHEQTVQWWIKQMYDQGDIYKSTYSGWYCTPCETFVTSNENEKVLHCPTCAREVQFLEEENYFFRLSAYEDRLLEFYEKHPDFITPKERLNEVISFVKSGLKDLSISRKGVKWGIPFPGDSSHTIYVWGDALLNYLSAIGYGRDDKSSREMLSKLWPASLQVMAKDIVRFHAVYWPAFLMASGMSLPKKLLVHGYILVGETKMSKSLGNAIDPLELAAQYGVDQVRYYLMRHMAINQDGNFSLSDLGSCITADLANNLGNLLQRMIMLALQHNLSEVHPQNELYDGMTQKLHVQYEEAFRSYSDRMNHYQFHAALADLWKFASEVNAYFNDQKPWAVAKENRALFEKIIHATASSLHMIALVASPIMPIKMNELLARLGIIFEPNKNYISEFETNKWDNVFMLKTGDALFKRVEENSEATKPLETKSAQEAVATNETASITIDDFTKVHLVVGTIQSCETIPGSDKLYKLMVDCGSYGIRQILSGIRKSFEPADLIGKQGIYVANLAPRTMMGLASHGMMLFAKDSDGTLKMVTVHKAASNGTRLS